MSTTGSATGSLRALLSVSVVLGAACGLCAPGAVAVADPGLANLLRFMAALKGAMALAAAALLMWRLRWPLPPGAALTAIAAVAAMAAASGLIWSLAHVALGALLFHAGLLLLLTLAWREARRPRPLRAGVQPWATWTATSFLRRNGSVQGGS